MEDFVAVGSGIDDAVEQVLAERASEQDTRYVDMERRPLELIGGVPTVDEIPDEPTGLDLLFNRGVPRAVITMYDLPPDDPNRTVLFKYPVKAMSAREFKTCRDEAMDKVPDPNKRGSMVLLPNEDNYYINLIARSTLPPTAELGCPAPLGSDIPAGQTVWHDRNIWEKLKSERGVRIGTVHDVIRALTLPGERMAMGNRIASLAGFEEGLIELARG